MQVNWGIISTWVDVGRFIVNAIVAGHRYSVWVVPAMEGAPKKLREDAFAGSVSRDGSWVAFAAKWGQLEYREMWLMRPDGTEARKMWDADPNTGFTGTEWSPDGQRLSYSLAHPEPNGVRHSIESRDLNGGPAAIEIPASGWDWSWMPDGRMLHVVGIGLDRPERTVTSGRFPLTRGQAYLWKSRSDLPTGQGFAWTVRARPQTPSDWSFEDGSGRARCTLATSKRTEGA